MFLPASRTHFSLVSKRRGCFWNLDLSHCILGAIIGQILVGLVCDRFGRKVALVGTTLLIVIGAILGTAAHGAHGSVQGLFWFLTVARGLTGIVRVFFTSHEFG